VPRKRGKHLGDHAHSVVIGVGDTLSEAATETEKLGRH
jgi:hypothetical protein